jgi:hypothetical protein
MSGIETYRDQGESTPRRKRRVFPWVFVAINLVFLVWVVAAAAGSGADNCGSLDAQTCQDANDAGAAIGIFLVVIFWAAVDVILGFLYLVFRLARR